MAKHPVRFLKPVALAAVLSGCSDAGLEVTLFDDRTRDTPLVDSTGMTHGVAWGDYDADGLPDLYVTNHLRPAQLLRNTGGGRFEDITASALSAADTGGDKHGAAWADFDNDGTLDLVQLTGAVQGMGEEPKRLLVNVGGKLSDRGAALGIDNPPGRTRMPLWIDLDRDGTLDLFQGHEARLDSIDPPYLFVQQSARFDANDAWLPLASRGAPFCIATALDADEFPELVCRLMGATGALKILGSQTLPAVARDLIGQVAFEDVVAADFDNDGDFDLLLARKNHGGRMSLALADDRRLTAQFELKPEHAQVTTGLKFRTAGTLHVVAAPMRPGDLDPGDVHLGSAGTPATALDFTVDRAAAAGLPSAREATRPTLRIGAEGTEWHVEVKFPSAAFGTHQAPRNIALRIESTAPLEAVLPLADSLVDEAASARLFINEGGSLREEADRRGLNDPPMAAVNAVGGDFDNDMDVDLFLLGSHDAGKVANRLYLNDGTGRFELVRDAGGAAGDLHGVGDSVTTADVDNDGFLDLLTASGASMGRSLGIPSDDGRYQLFRNRGNGNRWLLIDLVGTRSNRDGIGARVSVTAGGVTQTRFQDGGIHERGQNDRRLHFGLAQNSMAERISVTWPTGEVQELSKLPTNQVLRIEEPR